MKNKYVVVYDGKVASRIAETTDVPGYTIGILEPFFPDPEELNKFNKRDVNNWIKKNNQLLEDICKFLNERK